MIKYSNDINEIIALINSQFTIETTNTNCDFCISKITEKIDDEFLTARSECFKIELHTNAVLNSAIRKLTSICNQDKLECSKCSINKYCNHYIASRQDNYDTNMPKMIDLFCGAGGLSLGFTQAGYITSLANDIEPCCIDTYSHNHPEVPRKHIVLGDINDVVTNIKALMRFKNTDVLIGGPPCQGFSMANRQRLIDDPRNHLYKSYIEVLKLTQPKFFVMENVKGMLSASNQVIEDFKNVKYTVTARVLNAKDFGVPQNRERLIFIGNRIGYDNDRIFDKINELCSKIPKYTLADALYGLRPLSASRIKNSTSIETDKSGRTIDVAMDVVNEYINTINQNKHISIVFNHKARYNNDRDIEIFGRLNPGDKSDDSKIADIMPYSRRNNIFKDKYFKLEPDKVCKTITAHMKFDCNMYIHPYQARGLTPREAARVQSYPDDYFFRGAYTKTYMQIGNSVPPMLGRIIAQAIKEVL